MTLMPDWSGSRRVGERKGKRPTQQEFSQSKFIKEKRKYSWIFLQYFPGLTMIQEENVITVLIFLLRQSGSVLPKLRIFWEQSVLSESIVTFVKN